MNNTLPTIDFSKYFITTDELERILTTQTPNWIEEVLRNIHTENNNYL